MRQKFDPINNYTWVNLSDMTHPVQDVLSLTVLTAAKWHQALPLFHQVRLGLIHKFNNYNGLVIYNYTRTSDLLVAILAAKAQPSSQFGIK